MSVIYRALRTIETADGVQEAAPRSEQPVSSRRYTLWIPAAGAVIAVAAVALIYGSGLPSPDAPEPESASTRPAPAPEVTAGSDGEAGGKQTTDTPESQAPRAQAVDAAKARVDEETDAGSALPASVSPDPAPADTEPGNAEAERVIPGTPETVETAAAPDPVEPDVKVAEVAQSPAVPATITTASVETTQVEEPPAEGTSVEGTSVEGTSVEGTLIEGTLVEETPVEETSVEETSVEGTPVEGTSVEGTSVEETPVEETPVEETPVEETSVEETSVEGTSVEGTSVEGTSVEGTSVEGTSVEGTSVEGTSVEGTSVEGTSVEETPVEGTPEGGTQVMSGSATKEATVAVAPESPKHFVFNPSEPETETPVVASGFGLNNNEIQSNDSASGDSAGSAEASRTESVEETGAVELTDTAGNRVTDFQIQGTVEIPPQTARAPEPFDVAFVEMRDQNPTDVALAGSVSVVESTVRIEADRETVDAAPAEVATNAAPAFAADQDAPAAVEQERQQVESTVAAPSVELGTADEQVARTERSTTEPSTNDPVEAPELVAQQQTEIVTVARDVETGQAEGGQEAQTETAETDPAEATEPVAQQQSETVTAARDSETGQAADGQEALTEIAETEPAEAPEPVAQQRTETVTAAPDEETGQAADDQVALAEPSAESLNDVLQTPESVAVDAPELPGVDASTRVVAGISAVTAIAGRMQRVQLLRSKLNVAVNERDKNKAAAILQAMQDLLGEDSLYMLKARASAELSIGGDSERVKNLLQQVLARDPGDREAGINMAAAEIDLGEINAAKSRLKTLSGKYPEDRKIGELLQSIQ